MFGSAQASIQLQAFFLDANKGVSGITDLRSMMSTINKFTAQLVRCQGAVSNRSSMRVPVACSLFSRAASSVFKFDRENGRLFTYDGDGGELRVPVSNTTVAGFACLNGEVLRVEVRFVDPD